MPAAREASSAPSAGFWVVLGLAAVLRLVGIGYGLPAVFNSDEPHLVNLAVSFGKGSLRPELLKYPTLFPYLLFACYGLLFVFWSGFGLMRSVADFGGFFAWTPAPFYLIGRSVAAAATLAALAPVYRAAKTFLGETAAVCAAGLLAVSPIVVESAHASKPEGLMFCCAAFAWALAADYLARGRRRELVFTGVATGLALSTQYTAAPLFAMLVSAWAARRWRAGDAAPADLALAFVAAGAAFLAGSPYVALDFATFRSALADVQGLEVVAGPPIGPAAVVSNIFSFAGPWLPGAALAAGLVELLRRDKPRALWLLLPVAGYLAGLSLSTEGGWGRYLMAVYPALALIAGLGAEAAVGWVGGGQRAAALLTAALLAPGAWRSVVQDRNLLLPDTRTLSTRWVLEHIPQGKALLLDQDHASPRVAMDRATVEGLLARTREAGHPRARYFQYLLDAHPGGGYRVYKILRDFKDLHSHPGHVAFSQLAQPLLDVREGLAKAVEAKVDFVVLSEMGAGKGNAPELARFVDEVRREGVPVVSFEAEPGRIVGPRIEIYHVGTFRSGR